MKSFSKNLSNEFPNGKVSWDSKWSRGRGRLIVQYEDNTKSMEIAKGMKKLIKLTEGIEEDVV